MSNSQVGKGGDICTLTQHPKPEVRVTEGSAQHPQSAWWFLLQQGVRPLPLEVEWWHGEEGRQPYRGCVGG